MSNAANADADADMDTDAAAVVTAIALPVLSYRQAKKDRKSNFTVDLLLKTIESHFAWFYSLLLISWAAEKEQNFIPTGVKWSF